MCGFICVVETMNGRRLNGLDYMCGWRLCEWVGLYM